MLGETIRAARKSLKMTQKDLAERLGITASAITQIEKGLTNPDINKLSTIADILNINVDDMFTGEKTISIAKVPIIGETSCGSAIGSSFQDVGRTCYYRGDMFHNDLYCVIASGDSMAPEIEDGDEIVCDPRVKPAHGDLVHYLIHGESAVKVYVVDNDAHIAQFVPYNPSETFKTRTIRLDDEEAGELKIVKVVAVNKLKFNNKSARLKLIGRA